MVAVKGNSPRCSHLPWGGGGVGGGSSGKWDLEGIGRRQTEQGMVLDAVKLLLQPRKYCGHISAMRRLGHDEMYSLSETQSNLQPICG